MDITPKELPEHIRDALDRIAEHFAGDRPGDGDLALVQIVIQPDGDYEAGWIYGNSDIVNALANEGLDDEIDPAHTPVAPVAPPSDSRH
jgi:hypothetical protein